MSISKQKDPKKTPYKYATTLSDIECGSLKKTWKHAEAGMFSRLCQPPWRFKETETGLFTSSLASEQRQDSLFGENNNLVEAVDSMAKKAEEKMY